MKHLPQSTAKHLLEPTPRVVVYVLFIMTCIAIMLTTYFGIHQAALKADQSVIDKKVRTLIQVVEGPRGPKGEKGQRGRQGAQGVPGPTSP